MNEYENMTKEELLTRCLFLEEVVEEKNEQIEKMKCCENCNKYKKGKCTEDNMFFVRTAKQCKEWELAE